MRVLSLLLLTLSITSCSTIYYNFWESLGKEKRELLSDNVQQASDEQKATSKQLQDALAHLKAVYRVKTDAKLETAYQTAKQDYEVSKKMADELTHRIDKVNDIADDLFDEWADEIKEISNPSLKNDSSNKLAATKLSFAKMSEAMKKANESTAPILVQFHDNVLYLKHNLNAEAISGLSFETKDIEAQIQQLIAKMNTSIAESNRFITTLKK